MNQDRSAKNKVRPTEKQLIQTAPYWAGSSVQELERREILHEWDGSLRTGLNQRDVADSLRSQNGVPTPLCCGQQDPSGSQKAQFIPYPAY